jgi:hypothetical protein
VIESSIAVIFNQFGLKTALEYAMDIKILKWEGLPEKIETFKSLAENS